ncbi:MAG: DUF499 domain-containing protein, partial [Chloroflexia bacterium]
PFVEELLARCGSTFRVYQNTLLVLMPDGGEWTALHRLVRRLLALRAIEEDRALRQGLSEENRRTLQSRRDEAEKDVPFRLFYVYRHLAKPAPEGVEWLDLGIPTVGEKSLSQRVKEALRSRDLLVGKIAPTRLLQKALREDEAEKPLRDVVEAFLRYPQLPMLESEEVAWVSIRQGVQEEVLGVRVGERSYFGEPLPAFISPEDGVLVREVAPAVEPRPEEAPTPGGTGQVTGTSGRVAEPTDVTAPVPGIRTYVLRARVAWEKLSDFVRGVVTPLQNEAELEIEVSLRAQARPGGIQKHTLEHLVHETLRQIGAQILEESGEE